MALWLPPPSGWRAEPQTDRHVIFDGLYIDGHCVAILEAFDDDGPYYCNAVTPAGEHKRYGAGASLPAARKWAEIVTGFRPATP